LNEDSLMPLSDKRDKQICKFNMHKDVSDDFIKQQRP